MAKRLYHGLIIARCATRNNSGLSLNFAAIKPRETMNSSHPSAVAGILRMSADSGRIGRSGRATARSGRPTYGVDPNLSLSYVRFRAANLGSLGCASASYQILTRFSGAK
jgi:hypothetical protein